MDTALHDKHDTDSPDDLYQFDPDGDVQKYIRELRAIGPAPWVALPGNIPARAVVHPKLLRHIGRDPRFSKDANRHWPARRNSALPDDWVLGPWIDGQHAFAAEDNEELANHRRLRNPLDDALGRSQVDAMLPRITQITQAALDQVAQAGNDPDTGRPQVVDLRETLTLAVPILVISDLLGIPDHLLQTFQTCADTLFDTNVTPEQMRSNRAVLQATLGELITHRSEHPGDDLTSILLSKTYRQTLTPEERAATIRLIIVAAIETVGNLIASAIMNLLTHPEALAAVRSGEATWDDVVEETLRRDGPAGAVPLYFATEDVVTTIDTDDESVTILFEEGVPILPVWAAAGRDPDTNPNADVFELGRKTTRHMAFSHGPHFCAGAHLAVQEALIVVAAVFDRFPGLELAVPADTIGNTPGFIGNGPAEVPVYLHANMPDKTPTNPRTARRDTDKNTGDRPENPS
jgi:cytochrome P450